jgi:hypothetical protein
MTWPGSGPTVDTGVKSVLGVQVLPKCHLEIEVFENLQWNIGRVLEACDFTKLSAVTIYSNLFPFVGMKVSYYGLIPFEI